MNDALVQQAANSLCVQAVMQFQDYAQAAVVRASVQSLVAQAANDAKLLPTAGSYHVSQINDLAGAVLQLENELRERVAKLVNSVAARRAAAN